MTKRRGIVTEQEPVNGTSLINFRCHLPVAESFGFAQALRDSTQGRAFPQCRFDHWKELDGDATQVGSKANLVVEAIRNRKGMKPGIPGLENFHDKL